MNQIELLASNRDILGKKVRFLRRQGLTPANMYGHNIKSTALQIETSQLKHAVAQAGKSSLIALKVDGAKSPQMVIVRDIQREPLSGQLIHVDLYQVKMEENIKVEVPLSFVGEAPAIKERGGILIQNMNSLEIECLPANMPHNIELDLSGLTELDQALHVKDIPVAGTITVLTDPETAVVQIARSRAEVAEEEREEAVKAAEAPKSTEETTE